MRRCENWPLRRYGHALQEIATSGSCRKAKLKEEWADEALENKAAVAKAQSTQAKQVQEPASPPTKVAFAWFELPSVPQAPSTQAPKHQTGLPVSWTLCPLPWISPAVKSSPSTPRRLRVGCVGGVGAPWPIESNAGWSAPEFPRGYQPIRNLGNKLRRSHHPLFAEPTHFAIHSRTTPTPPTCSCICSSGH